MREDETIAEARRPVAHGGRGFVARLRAVEGQREAHRRAFSGFALRTDLAAVESDELLGDGEPEPAAA